jgi:hypothetical protein
LAFQERIGGQSEVSREDFYGNKRENPRHGLIQNHVITKHSCIACWRIAVSGVKGIAEVFGTGRDIEGLLTKVQEKQSKCRNPTSKQDKHKCTCSVFTSLDSE